MATDNLVDSRLVSGKGLLLYPPESRNRYLILYLDLVRPPSSPYYNANYNPPRSRYATLTFMRDGYVMEEVAMEFPKQIYTYVNDITGQNLRAIKCSYVAVMAQINNLATALEVSLPTIPDQIRNYESLRLNWDECRIVCYADTAISAKLYSLAHDVCNPIYERDHPPAPPPDVPAPVPSGTPLQISEPYVPGTDDNGRTVPNPLDQPPEPPPPPDCSLWEIVYRSTLFNGTTSEQARQYKAPYEDPVISGQYNEQLTVTHSGEGVNAECVSLGYNTVAMEFAPGVDPPPGGIITGWEIVSETQIL